MNRPLRVTGDVIATGDVEVNGGDLTSTVTSFNLLNQPTTIDFGAAATTFTLGANNSGTMTLRNANIVVVNDLAINGGDLTTTAANFNLLNQPTTINFGAAANTFNIGQLNQTVTFKGNILVDGRSTFTNDAIFNDSVRFNDRSAFYGNVYFDSDVRIGGNFTVNGNIIGSTFSTYNTRATFNDRVIFREFVRFDSDARIFGGLDVGREAYFRDDVVFYDNAHFDSDVSIKGSLRVNGTTTTFNTQNLEIRDTVIVLNKNQPSPLNDVGIIFQRYDSDSVTAANYNAYFNWNETNDAFYLGQTSSSGISNNPVSSQRYMAVGRAPKTVAPFVFDVSGASDPDGLSRPTLTGDGTGVIDGGTY
jgi:hypothetical protein